MPRVEHLEGRDLPAAGLREQYMLELVNRMRTNPAAELALLVARQDVQDAMSFFGVNQTLLQQQWATLTPQAPLAWNDLLASAALGHSQLMLTHDEQSHQLPGEPSLGSRITNAGYSWSGVAENIFAYADNIPYAHAAFAIDWGGSPATGGIQSPPGHRINIMSPSYSEVGIGIVDSTPGKSTGPMLITQDFGRPSSAGNPYLLGVVYSDDNNNGYYEQGEGIANATVTITPSGGGSPITLTTSAAGYYQARVAAGGYTVTSSASGASRSVTVGSANVKADFTGSAADPGAPVGTADLFVIRRTDASASSGSASVLSNDTGTATVATLRAAPTGGTVTLNSNGTFVYRPGATFAGIDTFTYRPGDGTLNGAATTVTILSHEALQVRKLYQQVLNREPDMVGWAAWSRLLVTGQAGLATVAAGIFESAERLDPIIAQFYTDYLGRTADAGGLAAWRGVWQREGGPESVVAGIVSSSEFFQSSGNTNTGWVTQVYQRLLGRPPEASGLSAWVAALLSGLSRQGVVQGFVNSTENQANLIRAWFTQYLGRSASDADVAALLGAFAAGVNERGIQIAIIGSAEYFNSPPPPPSGVAQRVT